MACKFIKRKLNNYYMSLLSGKYIDCFEGGVNKDYYSYLDGNIINIIPFSKDEKKNDLVMDLTKLVADKVKNKKTMWGHSLNAVKGMLARKNFLAEYTLSDMVFLRTDILKSEE